VEEMSFLMIRVGFVPENKAKREVCTNSNKFVKLLFQGAENHAALQ